MERRQGQTASGYLSGQRIGRKQRKWLQFGMGAVWAQYPSARLAGSRLRTGIRIVQRQWDPSFPSHVPSEPQASASS